MRERWLGATGVRVPEIAVEGELELPDGVLWLDEAAPEDCAPPTRRAGPSSPAPPPPEDVKAALAHPEVACALVPPDRRDLLDLDLTATDVRLSVSRQVAFVLGGGGHLGAAEVGMLGALFEREIRPDLIVGTSVGALHGAAAAADPTLGLGREARGCCGADCRSSACSAAG